LAWSGDTWRACRREELKKAYIFPNALIMCAKMRKLQTFRYGAPNDKKDYKTGLAGIGMPEKDRVRISEGLQRGQLPRDILDVVIKNEARIEHIHPDNYPWEACAGDTIYKGLANQGIDSRKVWEEAERYVNNTFKRGMPRICDTSSYEQALTNLFEIYALAKYHFPEPQPVEQLKRI
jgi:hypothetical protein